ncbi:MAG: PAS domain S-box protein, partial [Phenylobacterium sp.]|nr:PAS domain S-box protein [Phenylobacterium sp.]
MNADVRDDLFDLVHESIVIFDGEGRIQAWNAAAAELYGWSSDEAIGRRIADLLGGTATPPGQTLAGAHRWDGELRRRTADGRRVLIEARWT